MTAQARNGSRHAERKEFVRAHRTCVSGYNRKKDEILISTMAGAWQGQGSAAQPQDRALHPPVCSQVYCNARIDATMESDLYAVMDRMLRVYAVMAGNPMPDSVRANAEETCRREKRVVVRLKPYAIFEPPPRHVYSEQPTLGLRIRSANLCHGADASSHRGCIAIFST